jgi:hypothetical protein
MHFFHYAIKTFVLIVIAMPSRQLSKILQSVGDDPPLRWVAAASGVSGPRKRLAADIAIEVNDNLVHVNSALADPEPDSRAWRQLW